MHDLTDVRLATILNMIFFAFTTLLSRWQYRAEGNGGADRVAGGTDFNYPATETLRSLQF